MGSVINKKIIRFSDKRSSKNAKSKGERLGWDAIENEKAIPLRSIVGDGKIVKSTNCFMRIEGKFVL